MLKDPLVGYSGGFKLLHWFIALVVILMLTGSFFLGDVPDQYAPTAYLIHKSIGLTVLALMLFRLVWISYKGKPPLPESVPYWQKFASRVVQYGLYVFLILMPLSGWIMSVAANRVPSYFGLFHLSLPGIEPNEQLAELMEDVHKTIAWILITLIVLHIAGAFKHHFWDKDDVLRRMLPRRRQKEFVKSNDANDVSLG